MQNMIQNCLIIHDFVECILDKFGLFFNKIFHSFTCNIKLCF